MTTASLSCSLDSLVAQAIERLPPFRRPVARRRLSRPQVKQVFMEDLIEALHDDKQCCSLGLQPMFASSGFSAETQFNIDLDKLERLLQIIIEYLPKILEIIMKLFV